MAPSENDGDSRRRREALMHETTHTTAAKHVSGSLRSDCELGRRRGSAALDKAFSGGYEALFLDQLPYIEKVVAYLARRHALNAFDEDDFGSWVKLKLLRDDYAVLRKFRGRSKITTFLTTVVNNLYRDFRIQRWGKWRASAAARRLGDVGVQLESLVFRDGRTGSEAIRVLRENFAVPTSERELEAMLVRLKPRYSRRFETEEAVLQLAAVETTDEALCRNEHSRAWLAALKRVRAALGGLAAQDRLILRMRFEEGLTLAAIARELGLDQRRLYRRVQRVLEELRADLASS
jgi:RNA polymerase sigma factor for flagellar operon FliA